MTEEQLKDANDALNYIGIENVQDIVIIKKGATNKSVIKAIFPKAWESNYIDISNKFTLYIDNDYELEVDVDWWNAPYKVESEG